MAQTKWNMETEYIQSCNCDYGCPCNFNGYPTTGNCEALVGYKVTEGQFGNTKLDGVAFARAFWWPKAIHEGNGTTRLYVDSRASAEQAHAIEEICSGKHGGGAFEIFAKTVTKTYPTRRTKVDVHFGGYESSFTVEGVGEARSEHIRNPMTADTFEGTVNLPKGINFKAALVTSIKSWFMRDEDLLARHAHKAGFVTTTKFSNEGCLSSKV